MVSPPFFVGARTVVLACALSLISSPLGAADGAVVVTILQTTDLHGHLLPWDYARAQAADEGLARVASRIATIRKETPNVLLLDAGDTIQGTPIEFLHAKDPSRGPDPMAEAMSALKYDAMSVGNHEFNFGLAVLRKAQKESTFPWLSANTRNADGSAAFQEYLVKTVAGVRIGILGLTTPNIPNWEPERNRPGLKWEDPAVTARRLVPVLREKEKCDFVAILIHSGPEVDLKTGEPDGTDDENRVVALSTVPGIDLLLTGHTHRRIPLTRLNGVPMIQPGRWGDVLARINVTFTRGVKKGWAVADVKGELLPSDGSVSLDPAVVAIAAPHDAAARAYMDQKIAIADGDFPGARARLEDSALLDFESDTMRLATGADLAMTSLLPGRFEGWPKGPISVRQVYGLYPYENQLVALEIDGATLKACLEHAAEFYGTAAWEGSRLVLKPKENMIPYNFDVVQGATYRIDPTAPVGSRIKDLAYRGRPVQPSDRFTLAVNSYRAQGSGGYKALKGAKVVKEIPDEIRELLIARLKELGHVSPVTDRNWFVAPDVVWAPEARRQDAN
ncbi:MAG: bifunctional metallophosphatase/5'-nucleotidase [Thermoanaerobaculia bacterium]